MMNNTVLSREIDFKNTILPKITNSVKFIFITLKQLLLPFLSFDKGLYVWERLGNSIDSLRQFVTNKSFIAVDHFK